MLNFQYRIFFSLLMGKFAIIEQLLLTEWIKKNNWRMCIKGACTFLAGKFLIFKQPIINYVSQNRDET